MLALAVSDCSVAAIAAPAVPVVELYRQTATAVMTVGTVTIEKLAAAGAGCLVLEPGTTVLLEKPKVIELADRCKIAIVGWESPV